VARQRALARSTRVLDHLRHRREERRTAELVTAGPYAFIRHPIYTGLMLAMLGSTLAEAPFWLAPLIVFGIYFVYSARREERFMLERFPQRYAAYMTKMFLPLVV
jgi:protein-S-isoprenylcysteine O-methyltransferase Ste14